MSEVKGRTVDTASPDLLNSLAGIESGSRVGELRNQRSEIADAIQGSYNALLVADDSTSVSRVERGLIALRVAVLEESAPLIEHYRGYLAEAGAPAESVSAVESNTLGGGLSPRLKAILKHADLLTKEPIAATPAHLAELQAQGLSAADIVTISQLIAFLSFQVRAIAGLKLLAEES